MDWMNLPPLNSLRAFSAVAETASYVLAANRLNVTQAAVSQQVKALEKRLGVSLVARRRGGTGGGATHLTEIGRCWVLAYSRFRGEVEQKMNQAFAECMSAVKSRRGS